MPATIAEILSPSPDDPALVERIAFRTIEPPITILPPNPSWPHRFSEIKERIQKALEPTLVLDIAHSGSTSVPNLPAKDIIDVDLTFYDPTDEASYVKALENAGFRFLLREPQWYQHRFFVEDWSSTGYHVNLHVWGPDSPEVARHRILRDWLAKTPADRELYAKAKWEAAEWTVRGGKSMVEYTQRKDTAIQEILERAFRDLGYI
ncbi:GrpB family protein [Aspergillus ibericus CBS 121593]|uniref:UPF0157-domain-containing protein n=1 Tax=Aspergillus ibericus CBS 121593 TaxID=1448316 RepID=A0A395GIS9_9EURO|nr:UPF0157-domain-containing protein [Aspergillus ibericus CBS 121593]RAK95349.1 UPF0157-domain-containing protein [Aspergillus ibericus CBS 121593]